MRLPAYALALVLAAAPLGADEAPPPEADVDQGLSLLEQGAMLLLRGLAEEIEPAMRDMAESFEDFAANMEPVLRELILLMDDFSSYHAPEILPNGDIIIRRKRPSQFGPLGETDI